MSENLKNAMQAAAPAEARTFPGMLQQFVGEIARALPRHMTPDRMSRIALTAFRQNPTLAECDPRSVFGAVIQSAQLGLEIGLAGESYLVPFGKSKKVGKDWVKTYECQLIPGWQGLIKLAKNSGLVKDIYAHEVRVKDKFELTLGLKRDLVHEPLMEHGFPASDEARGEVTGFYAVAELKDGSKTFYAMSVHDVLRIRDGSSGYKSAVESAKKYNKPNNSPWVTDFVAMGKKTAIRALCKYLPKSPELQTAIELSDSNERGQTQALDAKQVLDGTWAVPAQDEDDEPNETLNTGGEQGQTGGSATPSAAPAEAKAGSTPAGPTYAELMVRTNKAAGKDDLDQVLSDSSHLPADQQGEIRDAVSKRLEAIQRKLAGKAQAKVD